MLCKVWHSKLKNCSIYISRFTWYSFTVVKCICAKHWYSKPIIKTKSYYCIIDIIKTNKKNRNTTDIPASKNIALSTEVFNAATQNLCPAFPKGILILKIRGLRLAKLPHHLQNGFLLRYGSSFFPIILRKIGNILADLSPVGRNFCIAGFKIMLADAFRRAIFPYRSLFQPKGVITKILDGCDVMAYKKHRTGLPVLLHLAQALLLEKGVAHRQGFINNQNIRLGRNIHGKRQTREHAAGIQFYRLVDEIPKFSECTYLLKEIIRFFRHNPQHWGQKAHVFPPCQLRIKTSAQFQQRGDTAIDFDLPAAGGKYATDKLQ